ncbi:MAG: metal-dependent transcriptional regulator, partial [Actinomycetota bacterium]
ANAIAERLDVSRPAVSEMMKKMAAEGLIDISDGIVLTEAGEELAQQVVRRHRLAERFLTDVLKLSWAEAHHEAGRWEHVMSASVEKAMDDYLGNPTTCPHGNPIPGSDFQERDLVPMASVPPGRSMVVRRITEELEFEPGLLEFLEAAAIQPGAKVTISSASPDGTLTLEVGGDHVGVGAHTGERILVSA